MSSSTPREEQVLVLFASQTGNSEQAAMEIADALPEKLSTPTLKITSRHMQLDDFLELHEAEWTRLVVIVCSSYGVGQAPLGGYRFREYCDALMERNDATQLEGLKYALLGLGDSKYTTFFNNPTITNEALQLAGATRVGDLGKADASADQLAIIQKWIDGIWPSLRVALEQDPLPAERLKEMQRDTIQTCREIDPEFMPEVVERAISIWTVLSVIVALLGFAWYYYNSTLIVVEVEEGSHEK
jgi:sulfite reductase alpha subunit-like flavoprotein